MIRLTLNYYVLQRHVDYSLLPGFIVNNGGTYGQAISIAGKFDVIYVHRLYMYLAMTRQN